MWDIIDMNTYKLYMSKKINLQLKVFDKHDYSEIYVNYKGYNIIFDMGIWGFGMDLEEWNIDIQMHGDVLKGASQMYYTVSKKDERAFIDLIYFFIKESPNADGMIREDCRIENW
jgi:hypothetical protein